MILLEGEPEKGLTIRFNSEKWKFEREFPESDFSRSLDCGEMINTMIGQIEAECVDFKNIRVPLRYYKFFLCVGFLMFQGGIMMGCFVDWKWFIGSILGVVFCLVFAVFSFIYFPKLTDF